MLNRWEEFLLLEDENISRIWSAYARHVASGNVSVVEGKKKRYVIFFYVTSSSVIPPEIMIPTTFGQNSKWKCILHFFKASSKVRGCLKRSRY